MDERRNNCYLRVHVCSNGREHICFLCAAPSLVGISSDPPVSTMVQGCDLRQRSSRTTTSDTLWVYFMLVRASLLAIDGRPNRSTRSYRVSLPILLLDRRIRLEAYSRWMSFPCHAAPCFHLLLTHATLEAHVLFDLIPTLFISTLQRSRFLDSLHHNTTDDHERSQVLGTLGTPDEK